MLGGIIILITISAAAWRCLPQKSVAARSTQRQRWRIVACASSNVSNHRRKAVRFSRQWTAWRAGMCAAMLQSRSFSFSERINGGSVMKRNGEMAYQAK